MQTLTTGELSGETYARGEPSKLAIVKRPKPEIPAEIYSIGMERIAYSLADLLELPVPETYLETVGGEPCSIQRRILHSRSWRQLPAAPAMKATIHNEGIFAKAALFDVWLGNLDRRDVNLLFEPHPPGTVPGRAHGCHLWLIDHGSCGLWPGARFEGVGPTTVLDSASDVDGTMRPEAERAVAGAMPPEYRMALKATQGPDRQRLLDGMRGIGDDALTTAVTEVPDDYMSSGQREATVAFLSGRQQKLDTVLDQYWC